MPLDDTDCVKWPPPHTRKMCYFLPVYLDERVCALSREDIQVVEGCPTEKHLVARMQVEEGTAYVLGQFGMWWPLDIDRAEAPLTAPCFTISQQEWDREVAREKEREQMESHFWVKDEKAKAEAFNKQLAEMGECA